jgi:hypothetical protein
MPKGNDTPKQQHQTKAPPTAAVPTVVMAPDPNAVAVEATYYLGGLFTEFNQQVQRYLDLTGQHASIEARIELSEKTLCVVRDHFNMKIADTDSALPHDWATVLASVRFVGWRLADACVELLKERQRMTTGELVRELNKGMFRFRTNGPLREVHAALLRQPSIKRDGEHWVWTGQKAEATESEEKKTVG